MTNEPKIYVKLPVEIEAMRLVGGAADTMAVCEWMVANGYPWLTGDATQPATLLGPNEDLSPKQGIYIDPADGALCIRTLEGDLRATLGDWVIKGIAGEFYPCKPEIFDKTYILALPVMSDHERRACSHQDAYERTYPRNNDIIVQTVCDKCGSVIKISTRKP